MAKNKKKKAPKDIVYRLVMAIMAVCVPIAAYFSDYIYYVVKSDLFKLLAQLKGDTSDTGDTWGTISLRTIVEEYLPKFSGGGMGEGNVAAALVPLKPAAISLAVFFVLALVLAVVIFFFACFSKKKTVPICLSTGGLLSMIGVYASFHYVAAPILDGTINLGSFVAEGTTLARLLPYLGSVSDLRLTTGFFLMVFLFLAMMLWAGANKIVEIGEKTEKGRTV